MWWVSELLANVPVYPLSSQVQISDFKNNFITRSGTESKHSTKSRETRWMEIDYLTSID